MLTHANISRPNTGSYVCQFSRNYPFPTIPVITFSQTEKLCMFTVPAGHITHHIRVVFIVHFSRLDCSDRKSFVFTIDL